MSAQFDQLNLHSRPYIVSGDGTICVSGLSERLTLHRQRQKSKPLPKAGKHN